MNFKIPKPAPADAEGLLELAEVTGVFELGEIQALLGSTLEQFFALQLASNHLVWIVENLEDSKIAGWSYFAESSMSPGIWDVWWIGVHPLAHGSGAARFLLTEIEKEITRLDGRVIIIETSSDQRLARARAFYPKLGYEQRGVIPDFYAMGTSKTIFSKTIVR